MRVLVGCDLSAILCKFYQSNGHPENIVSPIAQGYDLRSADRESPRPMPMNPDLMTVTEVADYLRVRERTIYELVRTQRIPSCKLSGKLLFPKRLIELWVAQSADYPHAASHLTPPPPVIAGSHDPLLEWAVRESRCELAILVDGSTGGMHRLLAGQAVACGLHLIDPATGEYDASILANSLPGLDYVVIEWARRRQGLVVAQGNPAEVASVADLGQPNIRVAIRQEGSGSRSEEHTSELQSLR